MLHLDSITQLESVSFKEKYTTIRKLDSPNDEYRFELETCDDAYYLAELFDYLIRIFSNPWTMPSSNDMKVATLLMNYFYLYFKSGPDDLLNMVENCSPRYPQVDPSWADICMIRVGIDNENVTFNPRYVRGALSDQCSVDIKIEKSKIDPRFEFNNRTDATRFERYVKRTIKIYNDPNSPTRDQIIRLLSDKNNLRGYLRPRSGAVFQKVSELLRQGRQAKRMEDSLLVIPLIPLIPQNLRPPIGGTNSLSLMKRSLHP